jgi:hypothetical protein
VRTLPRFVRAGAVVLVLLSFWTPSAHAAGSTRELTPDGVWSWFSDPRAICHDGTVYTGWVTKDGHIQVAAHSTLTDRTEVVDLERYFESDDHNYPAFYPTSDGRLTAFYAMHSHTGVQTQLRVTEMPWDISDWSRATSTETNTSGGGGTTYSNPYTVPGETDRILFFWRGGNWKPNYCTGTYDPQYEMWSWTRARTLIIVDVGRPYVKYDAFSDEKIGVAFTNCHPKEGNANLYYAYIAKNEAGEVSYYRTDGTFIRTLAEGPLEPSDTDLIYQGADPWGGFTDAWIWDTAFDPDGNPVMVYATFPSVTQHTYHWARFDGTAWQSHVILEDAGGSVADTTIGNPQYYYSGGIALDHDNVGVVYVSHQNDLGGFDLERWETGDDGSTWSIEPITEGSTVDNMRPVVPIDRPPDTDMVLWLSGVYDYYANLESERWWPEGSRDYNYETAVHFWIVHRDDEPDPLGRVCELLPANPNPFSVSSRISFRTYAVSGARLEIFDVAGRKIATLFDESMLAPGPHSVEWNGRDASGERVGSGVYFVLLTTDRGVATGKVAIAR